LAAWLAMASSIVSIYSSRGESTAACGRPQESDAEITAAPAYLMEAVNARSVLRERNHVGRLKQSFAGY
jgi:hypothetical protein